MNVYEDGYKSFSPARETNMMDQGTQGHNGGTIGEIQGPMAALFKVERMVMLPILAFLAYMVIQNSLALSAIQASKFTVKDALQVWTAIYEVREKIAGLPQKDRPQNTNKETSKLNHGGQ